MPTPSTDTATWLKLSAHLDRALDLSPLERDAWLEQLRATEPQTAAELAVMLADHRQLRVEGFLDSSALSDADTALAGVDHRLLHADVAHWRRRHGHGVAGAAQRRALRGPGRDQAVECGAGRPGRRRTLPARRCHPRAPQPSAYRAPDRRGRLQYRPALPRARARQGRSHRRLLRRTAAVDPAPCPLVPRRAVGGVARAHQLDRASRSETVERADRRGRRR